MYFSETSHVGQSPLVLPLGPAERWQHFINAGFLVILVFVDMFGHFVSFCMAAVSFYECGPRLLSSIRVSV